MQRNAVTGMACILVLPAFSPWIRDRVMEERGGMERPVEEEARLNR